MVPMAVEHCRSRLAWADPLRISWCSVVWSFSVVIVVVERFFF